MDGKYDWILPRLQIICKAVGERSTARNMKRHAEEENSEVALTLSLNFMMFMLTPECHRVPNLESLTVLVDVILPSHKSSN